MSYNIRIVSTYPPRRCGIGTFSRHLTAALNHFSAEVANIAVAAIDKDRHKYKPPVDFVIDQYNPASWQKAARHIINNAEKSSQPTIVLLQHEYGLDPDENGKDARGKNFLNLAKTLQTAQVTTFVYLHTILDRPNQHQKKVLQNLAENSDGLIVTTESAVRILESKTYAIDPFKLKHIDHGIRMQHPSNYDRREIKEKYGLQKHFLITTLGLLSPDKGIKYGIRALGQFLKKSCTDQQKKQIVYLIAGQCHPDFVKSENGIPNRKFQKKIDQALQEHALQSCRVTHLKGLKFEDYDVVFLDTYMDETTLLNLYGATNLMLLPYLNMQQISSGILADTLGSGRVAIATKFRYAVELIHSNRPFVKGLVIGRHARGILVDPDEPSVNQIANALDLLLFNRNRRLRMERQAHQRGYQMRWQNTAWALLEHIDFTREQQQITTGRGVIFRRKK